MSRKKFAKKSLRIQDKVEPPPVNMRTIKFSFQFAVLEKHELALDTADDTFLRGMVTWMKHYSTLNPENLASERHCHTIKWNHESIPERFKSGFPGLNPQQKDCTAWQLYVTYGGRIHGFLYENFFHVIWFDPHHLLYEID